MSNTAFQVVFDATQEPYQWWLPGIGIAFILFGLLVLLALRRAYPASKLAVPFMVLWLSLASCFTITTFAITLPAYNTAQELLSQGRASVVEGPVESFHPMSPTGHDRERFTVQGVRFEVSSYSASLGFNKDSAHGGPLREGLYVRIYYARIFGDPLTPTILRLEIRK